MKIGSRVLDLWFAGSILESKGICAIFQKKGKKEQKNVKKGQKRVKYLKIWAKMYRIGS